MSDVVEYEIISAQSGFLEGRFKVGDKQVVCAIHWNGLPDHLEVALKKAALMALNFLRQPPRPTPEMLQAHIGKRGHLRIE
jgi:hypothetical protein